MTESTSVLINHPIKKIGEEPINRSVIEAVSISYLITLLPHFMHLPLWVTGVAVAALLWRNLQVQQRLFALPRWLLVPMVMVGGISVFAQYWTIAGRDPGLALLTIMSSFKFLETRTHRDVLILVFLSYFLLATHFLFTQSMLIAAYMLVTLIIITMTLMTINQRDNSVTWLTRFRDAGWLIVLSVPIMILLFVLVPRIPGPLWGLSQEQRGGITGLSNEMSPGSVSDLVTSNEVAFRVSFDNEIPAQSDLYWRGPIFADFDRNTWRPVKTGIAGLPLEAKAQSTVTKVSYSVTLEPHGKHWLFALDYPQRLIKNSYLSNELQLLSKKPVNDLKRYTMSSDLTFRPGLEQSFDYLVKTLEFPEQQNPKTLELGKQWRQKYQDDWQIVTAALNHFREQSFYYTLQPPLLGQHASDDFLFSTRRGFCEHFASSFTLLMRAADIPARVVTGYQGGELNQVGDYLIVRQSDAHAWSEVWLEDRGWVRVDPTAAVSPDRVEQGLDQALPDIGSSFKISNRNPLLSKLLYNWDNLKYIWNDWILNYDHRKQSRFLSRLGLGIRSWGDMIIALVISLTTLVALYVTFSWWKNRPEKPPEYEQIINRLMKKLSRIGLSREAHEPMSDFAARIKRKQLLDRQLEQILISYEKIKYARGYNQTEILKSFARQVDNWKPVKS